MNNEESNETVTLPLEESASSPMMTIGKLLKSKREERGLSLKVISQQTKIHLGLLENLEADFLDKLPSKTYVRGFVKSTTKILDIDQEFALHLLDMTYNENLLPPPPPVSDEMKNQVAKNMLSSLVMNPLNVVKSISASSGIFLLKTFTLLFVVGVTSFSIKNYIEKSNQENEVILPEVLTTTQRRTPRPAKPMEVVKQVATPSPQPIEVNIIQDKKEKPVDITVNNIKLKTISLGEKQFAPNDSLTPERIDELFPKKFRAIPPKGTETIFINASEGDCWLTYKVDDGKIKKFILKQGRTLLLRGSLIRLFLGDTRTINVFYKNKPVKIVTNNKSTKNIVLPEELKTNYMDPLFIFEKDGSAITSEEHKLKNQPPSQVVTP